MSEQRLIKTSRILLFSLSIHLFFCPLSPPVALSNGYGGNSPLTPSARISALNIVSDLLRKVGVSHSFLWARASRSQISVSLSLLCWALRRKSLSFHCSRGASSFSLFTSPHRLWSPSSPLAGTLPRTRERGRRTLWTTATRSTQTQPTTRSRSTRHILTKREWNRKTHLYLRDDSRQESCSVTSQSVEENLRPVCIFFPAGQRWSHSLHWFWVMVAPPPVTWECWGECMQLQHFSQSSFPT